MQEFNPVLVTGFNRPQHLEQLLSTLIALNCEIFISMDLAKPGDKKNQNLNQQCLEVIAKYLSNISAVNIAKENLGCFRAVTEGISWAFEKTESLIILEDDLFVDERFLSFASWALGEFKDDNSIGNLRLATKTQQCCNRYIFKCNTSGFKGVSKHKNKWEALISINRKKIY
jgi:hypothetical protein